MKKLLSLLLLFLAFPTNTFAANPEYLIESFDSQIMVNQNTSLEISEKIQVNFFVSKHGLYRIIPTAYSHQGKTIDSKLSPLKTSLVMITSTAPVDTPKVLRLKSAIREKSILFF